MEDAMDQNSQSGLGRVKSIIAVASCKGGVGKSTMAATLANELVGKGFKVGLLDADLFGPSLPTLFNLNGEKVDTIEGRLVPVEYFNGLKLMSFGFLMGDTPAVMRGPMVSNYIQQILHNVEWGELDYLLLDMPPGTGDIQLTISQSVRLSGAVIVTTRASLSLADVTKGILMFEQVKVPMLGVIENMSHFVCDSCDKKHAIFGEENSSLEERFGLKTLAQVPLTPSLAHNLVKDNDREMFSQMASNLLTEVEKQMGVQEQPPRWQLGENEVVIEWEDGENRKISNLDLRDNCHCASCIDEYTGEKKLKRESIPSDIKIVEAYNLGHYAVGVRWSDGHSSSIYPYKRLKEI
jgi:Mrp family chromosome partitioning ATPase/DUF971 family protein